MMEEEEDVPTVSVDLTIGGVKVRFPYKPYPAQTVLMSKIISGCKNSQNCLLESPTGSGKTLALLCATLAWQAEEHAKKRKYDAENLALTLQQEAVNDGTAECDSCNCAIKESSDVKMEVISDDDDFFDDDPDFKPTPKKPVRPLTQKSKEENKTDEEPCECACHQPAPLMVTRNQDYYVPRIYYGTRTHKQIAQLTAELAKTAYRNVKMDILASREHTCIHEYVSKQPNKNEECKKLLEMPGCGCGYKIKAQKLDDYGKLYEAGLRSAWDLETFVDVARTKGACPYFATRELFSKADIIFCPYSYLIDPFIRNSMNIALKRDIVIFDEAHNIEDACREAASIQISRRDMEEVEKGMMGWETPLMLATLEKLKNFIVDEGTKIADTEVGGQMSTSIILGGADLVATLETRLGLTHGNCAQLNQDLTNLAKAKQSDEVIDKKDRGKSNSNDPAISVKLESVLSHLLGICSFIQEGGNKHAEDFRMLVSKQQVTVEDNARPGEFVGKGRNRYRHEINYTLHFWCLNPAITFKSIVENARCIVLASGTLSPMNTFQSELGTNFPVQFEAGHVIGKSQVFAGCIGVSPRDKPLQAVYKFTETFEFQDGIGELTEEVCRVTPGGVLLFFTSYRLIDKMVDRWRSTGLFDRLSSIKKVFFETSGATAQFEETLADFYASCGNANEEDILSDDGDAISPDECAEVGATGKPVAHFGLHSQQRKKRKLDEKPIISRKKAGVTPMSQRSKMTSAAFFGKNAATSGSTNGALFLAVYRGKVSEGLNFADDYARAVIAVGIPYPALLDPLVKEKRNYNELHSRTRQILSGAEWYECQAFRALNQALGRCIRHRKDWGAIILVDERFCQQKLRSNDKISKWVREHRVVHHNFNTFRRNLVEFIKSEKFGSDGNLSQMPSSLTPIAKVAPKPIAQAARVNVPPLSKPTPAMPTSVASSASTASISSANSQAVRPKFTFSPVPVATRKAVMSPPPSVKEAIVIDDSPVKASKGIGAGGSSPDVFDSASDMSTDRSSSAASTIQSTSKNTVTTMSVSPSLSLNFRPTSSCFLRCSHCTHEIFTGNCFSLSTASPTGVPALIVRFFSKAGRALPSMLRVAEIGKYGPRGNDQLMSSLLRVEGRMDVDVYGNGGAVNATFDPDDMCTYESYVCKCFVGIRGEPIDVVCWSIIGIQLNNTSKAVSELMNKVIFNPYAVLFSSVVSD